MIEPDSGINHLCGEVKRNMGRTKLIVREVFQGERSLEELIAPLILAHPPLTDGSASVIIESTEQPQDSLCSEKGADDGTSDE